MDPDSLNNSTTAIRERGAGRRADARDSALPPASIGLLRMAQGRAVRCAAGVSVSILAMQSLWTSPACAAPPDTTLSFRQVGEMSIEELMAVQVTSVAGVGQDWFATPAAIAVITGEDVRRGGFRTLADSLRLAPGVFVGQSSSSGFSVGMRGFNGSLANKTLVLIDGRAVYDPLYGGTFWDVQDVMLDDLDRIEVIRGPGATLWGANAVNGVINISTKSAKDTQGLLITTGGGTFEKDFTEARYGLKIGDDAWLRVFGKWLERDHLVDAHGNGTHDDWEMLRGGFRFDREGSDNLNLTIQGDVYNTGRLGEFTPNAPVPGQNIQFFNDIRDVRRSGVNVLGRISKEHADNGWSLQAYYDRTERVTNVTFEVDRDTFDLDWRHHFKAGDSHEIMWGLSARYTRDQTENGVNLILTPPEGAYGVFGGFVQDTITLVPKRLFAMIGSKISHNDYTGFEVQPSARLWWTPNEHNTLWASVSRAVRIPARTEEQGSLIFGYIDSGLLSGGPLSGHIIGLGIQPNSNLQAESLIAYEAGYRVRLNEHLTVDASGYYNDYSRLIYVPSVIAPFDNNGYGETYGGELAMTWQVADNLRIKAAYSHVEVQIHGPVLTADEGNTPRNQAQIQSYLDITKDLELNAALYYVDSAPEAKAASYLRLDVGVDWRVTPNFEVSVWGQNLLQSQHREFSTSEVQRGVFLKGTIRF